MSFQELPDVLDTWALRQPTKVRHEATFKISSGEVSEANYMYLQTLFSYLDDDGKTISSFTYQAAAAASRQLAQRVIKASNGKLQRGDRVLLVFLPSLDFIITFIACLRAGLVAVPVYPPNPRRLRAYITAFAQIARDSGATVALSHAAYLSAVSLASLRSSAVKFLSFGLVKTSAVSWPELTWLNTTELLGGGAATATDVALPVSLPRVFGGDLTVPPTDQDEVVFLQYTSGSTAAPKGVMITRGNLAHNLATIVAALEAGSDTVVVSWLPQYHDMGLIGSLLGTLHCGGSGVYMSPLSFIKRPVLWLESMSRYKATHVQSPNFGYRLAARKWREAYGPGSGAAARAPPALDLSSVRHMFNAAEPITAPAISEFFDTFAPFGLRAAAMRPGYGLAEHTVYVSDGGTRALALGRRDLAEANRATVLHSCAVADAAAMRALAAAAAASQPEPAVVSVSCGPVAPHASPGQRCSRDIVVLVVDAATREPLAAPGAVGEVWLHSASVAAGYWGQPEASAAAFRAQLAPPTPQAAGAVTAGESATAAAGGGGGETAAEAAVDAAAAGPATASAAITAAALFDAYRGAPFLRTGDLGFIAGGELYICGRAKDLLIVRGRNFYPQDVEAAAETDARLRPGCCAVFQAPVSSAAGAASATEAGEEEQGVVLVAEVRDAAALSPADLAALCEHLRAEAAREHGVALSAVLLLRPHAARKTTSGKIARSWNRVAFLAMGADAASPWHASTGAVLLQWRYTGGGVDEAAAALDSAPSVSALDAAPSVSAAAVEAGDVHLAPPAAVAYPPPGSALEGPALLAALQREIARALRVASPASVDPRVALVDYGLDSMAMVQLGPVLRAEYGLEVADGSLFADGLTLGWMVAQARALRARAADPTAVVPLPPHSATAAAHEAGPTLVAIATGVHDGGGPAAGATPQLEGRHGGEVAVAGFPLQQRHQMSWFQRNFPCCMCCW